LPAVNPGLRPGILPRSFAAFNPALVRSTKISRSNSAKERPITLYLPVILVSGEHDIEEIAANYDADTFIKNLLILITLQKKWKLYWPKNKFICLIDY
jgi:hypothetical protein